MKGNLFFVLAFILPIISFSQDWTTQVGCPNSPVVYNPFYDEDGDFIIPYQLSPPYAVYTTGSASVPQILFNNNGSANQYWGYNSLSVTWPNAGKGLINATASSSEDPDGWNAQIYVNIGSQPIFTSSPSLLCHGQSSTFTVSDVCGSSYVWSAPTGWSINGGSNTLTTSSKSVSITAPSTGNGNAQITVRSNNSYDGAVSKNVWLGVPSANGSTLIYPSGQRGVNPVTLSTGAIYQFRSDAVTSATSFTWTLPSGFSFYSGATTSSPQITTSATTGFYTLYCRANNSCGSAYTNSLGINITTGGGGGHPAIFVTTYPNPASSTMTLQVGDSLSVTEVEVLDEPYQLSLIDKFSHTVYSIQASEKKIQIPLEGIPNDIYYLNLSYKGKILRRQIVVKK